MDIITSKSINGDINWNPAMMISVLMKSNSKDCRYWFVIPPMGISTDIFTF